MMTDIIGNTVGQFRKDLIIKGRDKERYKILFHKNRKNPRIIIRYGDKHAKPVKINAANSKATLFDDMIIIEDIGGNKKKQTYSIVVDEL